MEKEKSVISERVATEVMDESNVLKLLCAKEIPKDIMRDFARNGILASEIRSTLNKSNEWNLDLIHTDELTNYEWKCYALLAILQNSEYLSNGYWLASVYDRHLIIDTEGGKVHAKRSDDYSIKKCGQSVSLIDAMGKPQKWFDGSNVSLNGLAHTKVGGNDYPAIRFGKKSSYGKSLRAHWVIALFKFGLLVLFATGADDLRLFDIHHKIPVSNRMNNSINNLGIMTIRDHKNHHNIE